MKAVLQEKSTHSCERTMKEYVRGLFTTKVGINWTSDYTQLYFVESIRKNFVLTDGTGSYCNGGLHSLFYKPQWFKICFLGFIMIKKRCDVAAFAKLSHVTLHARTVTDGNLSVVEKGRFFCRSHILALIFVDSWSQVVWGRLWHRYHRIICANVGKNQPETLTSFIVVGRLFTTYCGRFCTISWSEISLWNNFFH